MELLNVKITFGAMIWIEVIANVERLGPEGPLTYIFKKAFKPTETIPQLWKEYIDTQDFKTW